MSGARRFFVERAEEETLLEGEEFEHAKNVLRLGVGEEVILLDNSGKEYSAVIAEVGKRAMKLHILRVNEGDREAATEVALLFGYLKNADKNEFIVQKAVELGAWEIIPVTTRRTVVKLDQKKAEAKRKRWNAISESAAKQSGRTVIPQVGEIVTFKEAIARGKSLDKSLIPYECADDMAETRAIVGQLKKGMDIGIFIGPEGGFDKEEIQEAMDAGIRPITLGKRILRTETAGLAALSILMFALEEG